jgi:hypothetical protein
MSGGPKNVLGHLPPDVQKKLWQEIQDDTAAAEKRANAKPLRAIHFPAQISAQAAGKSGGRKAKAKQRERSMLIRQERVRQLEEAAKTGKRAPQRVTLERKFKVSKSVVDRACKGLT